MSNDVSVTIDVANQSITSSDTNIITVPTQNFEIVTFDNKPCIRALNDNYATFTLSSAIKSLSCDVFLQAVDGFTLLIEFDSILNTKYSLVYYPHGSWWNPDRAVFDSNNVLVGVWVTVTYSSTNKTLTFDNGTNQLTRVLDSSIADLSIGNFSSRYNIYLTNLGAETSTRYVNKGGIAEIWANIKNYITAQLLGKADSVHTHTASDITDLPSGSSQLSQIASKTIAPGQGNGNSWSFTCTANKPIYIEGSFYITDTGGGITLSSGGDVVMSVLGGAPGKAYNKINIWSYTGDSKNSTYYVRSIIRPTSTTITISIYLLGGGSYASFYAYQ